MARQRKLSPERKEFITSLLNHYNPKDANDVQEMLKDLLGDTLQGMLEAEMDEQLGYSKYDYKNKETDDSRNGYSKKTVTSSLGDIDLDIPGDRKGEFEPRCRGHHDSICRRPHRLWGRDRRSVPEGRDSALHSPSDPLHDEIRVLQGHQGIYGGP